MTPWPRSCANASAAGVTVLNLVSSPGAGKTALLERTMADLPRAARAAALVGDLATETTPAGYHAAVRRCAKSSPPASATWRPRWWPRT